MDAYRQLLDHDIKPSQQRIALMDFLLMNPIHPTAEEVYSRLCKKMPTLSKTTVYNTLKLFVQRGAAQMLTIDERNACFDANTAPHAHFLCKECTRIYDLHEIGNVWSKVPGKVDGCQVDEIQLYYRGICEKCIRKQKK